jgi:transcriptional regulator with XRE-family HTH domain
MAREGQAGGMNPYRAQTRLESFRRGNRITVRRLARESGVSRQHLYRLRKGKGSRNPSLRFAVALARAFARMLGRSVRLSDLFEVDDVA